MVEFGLLGFVYIFVGNNENEYNLNNIFASCSHSVAWWCWCFDRICLNSFDPDLSVAEAAGRPVVVDDAVAALLLPQFQRPHGVQLASRDLHRLAEHKPGHRLQPMPTLDSFQWSSDSPQTMAAW